MQWTVKTQPHGANAASYDLNFVGLVACVVGLNVVASTSDLTIAGYGACDGGAVAAQ